MPLKQSVTIEMKEVIDVTEKTINADDIKRYLTFSNNIAEMEETLYESGDKLDQEESKINDLAAEQDKIRFDQDENDLFIKQLETVIETLAANYKEYGFDYNLYFDLVYNLLLLEYGRMDQLKNRNKVVADMFDDIEITGHLKGRVKSLLDHEEEMEEARKMRPLDE
jgi:hypothetical protein